MLYEHMTLEHNTDDNMNVYEIQINNVRMLKLLLMGFNICVFSSVIIHNVFAVKLSMA